MKNERCRFNSLKRLGVLPVGLIGYYFGHGENGAVDERCCISDTGTDP